MEKPDNAAQVGLLATPQQALAYMLAGKAVFTLCSLRTGARYTYKVVHADVVCTACGGVVERGAKAVNAGGFALQRHAVCPANPKPPSAKQFFAKLLAGPDNNQDYVYLGLICKTQRGLWQLRMTKASSMLVSSLPVQALQFALAQVQKPVGAVLHAALQVWHSGHCGRCGRLLTVPASIASGFGPECAGRV